MTKKTGKLDLNQLAKRIVDNAIGEDDNKPELSEKEKATIELGRLGGLKGGKARAESLTPEQRSDIARLAAIARWKKSN